MRARRASSLASRARSVRAGRRPLEIQRVNVGFEGFVLRLGASVTGDLDAANQCVPRDGSAAVFSDMVALGAYFAVICCATQPGEVVDGLRGTCPSGPAGRGRLRRGRLLGFGGCYVDGIVGSNGDYVLF